VRSSLKIQAFAGTGKTTTLAAIAESLPQRKFLYLLFNRTAADEAQLRMPSNVWSALHMRWLPKRRLCLQVSPGKQPLGLVSLPEGENAASARFSGADGTRRDWRVVPGSRLQAMLKTQ
jgi:F-box protein 18 (helicase)